MARKADTYRSARRNAVRESNSSIKRAVMGRMLHRNDYSFPRLRGDRA